MLLFNRAVPTEYKHIHTKPIGTKTILIHQITQQNISTNYHTLHAMNNKFTDCSHIITQWNHKVHTGALSVGFPSPFSSFHPPSRARYTLISLQMIYLGVSPPFFFVCTKFIAMQEQICFLRDLRALAARNHSDSGGNENLILAGRIFYVKNNDRLVYVAFGDKFIS